MSKIADGIECRQLHRVAVVDPVSAATIQDDVSMEDDYYLYKLGVFFAIKGSAKNATQLAMLKDRARKQIVGELYDEFRPALRTLAKAIYERKWDDAMNALTDLEKEMFS